jgi:hypothetical protein
MKRVPLPLLMGFLTAAALALTQAEVGFVRDEGYYFTAAQSYEGWLRALPHSLSETERYWSVNFEHPPLAKLLFAVSHLLFSTWLRVLPDALAWRLPAFVFAGLLSYWLSTLALRRSRAAAVLAPLLFWCAERTFFHGHLAAFDVPICAMTAGVAVAWLRIASPLEGQSLKDFSSSEEAPMDLEGQGLKHSLWLAFLYGCALATKHNAWFLPPVLLVHALLLPRPARARALRALPFLLLSPLVLFAAWPLLWHEPLRHLREWISFHLHHVHYAWEYLGRELRAPPFPIEYPLVVDALALPITTVALYALALASLLTGFARRRLDPARLLELGVAGAARQPVQLRSTPHVGGLKHWLAFLALLAPEAASILTRIAERSGVRRALPLAAAAALLPGLWQIVHVHPYGTSAYGELAGDLSGAASLGMQRQYWSNNVTGVLPWLNANCPPGARVFFHEVNFESYRAYLQSGQLRKDILYASGPGDAQYAALQWHREFRDREPETWNAFGTRRPSFGLYLDETPQVVVYARPGLPGAP